MLKKAVTGFLVLLCVAGIFYLTCQTPEQTWEFTRSTQRILRRIGVTVEGKALRHYVHYLMYFVLGAVIFIWDDHWWMILVGFGIGFLDEGLKIWLPTREFDWTDLLRDFAGIIAAYLFVLCARKIWRRCHTHHSQRLP